MPENGGVDPWFEVQGSKFKVGATPNLEPGTSNLEPETLNILQIGWASLDPINISENGAVLLIHARVINPASSNQHPVSSIKYPASSIRFTLNNSPLSELADGNGNVLQDARLSVADAGEKVQGSRFKVEAANVVVYPNPAKEVLNVEFVIDNVDGKTCHDMSLQLFTMQGVVVAKQNVADIKTGLNKIMMDLRDLPNGAYLLKVFYEDEVEVRKVIVNR
jgi:hypothetical protein